MNNNQQYDRNNIPPRDPQPRNAPPRGTPPQNAPQRNQQYRNIPQNAQPRRPVQNYGQMPNSTIGTIYPPNARGSRPQRPKPIATPKKRKQTKPIKQKLNTPPKQKRVPAVQFEETFIDRILQKIKLPKIGQRHSSLGALIMLVLCFAAIVTTVSVGAYKQSGIVVVEEVPSFTFNYTKQLADGDMLPMDKVDVSGYAERLAAEVYSQAAILMDLGSGIIIAQKESDARVFPASLTKIMTALIAVEELTDLDEKYMFTDEIFITLRGQNASTAGFEAWETVTHRDLIYGVMLPSGAEASIAVAELIAGSETGFAALMNDKAVELGMSDTHFVNATGLHDDEHYTTVTDLARLLDYALHNDTFRELFTTKSYTTSRTKYHPTGMTFESTVFRYIRAQGENRNNKFIIGGKTGFTNEGGQCLATIANDGEFDYILITTGAGEGTNRPYYNVLDHIYLYDRYLDN